MIQADTWIILFVSIFLAWLYKSGCKAKEFKLRQSVLSRVKDKRIKSWIGPTHWDQNRQMKKDIAILISYCKFERED